MFSLTQVMSIQSNMVDLTGAHLYSVGGAYCDLRSLLKEKWMIRESTNKGFIINRNVQSFHD